MRSKVTYIRRSGDREVAFLGRAQTSNSSGHLLTSLLVARCQRPCFSSLGDLGPPGAMIHMPAPEDSASYPLYMYLQEESKASA